MKTLDEIRDAALMLPLLERATLAEELIKSVSTMPGVREEDLQTVLASRIAALERGEEELLDGPTALAEIPNE